MKKIITSLCPAVMAGVMGATGAQGQGLVAMPPGAVSVTNASHTANGIVIVSGEQNNDDQAGWRLFDGITNNHKWCVVTGTDSAWVVYQFSENAQWAVTNYVLWTASEGGYYGRDPGAWRLEGSNDLATQTALHGTNDTAVGKATWEVIDERVNANAPSGWGPRGAAFSFDCSENTTPYNAYRLNVLSSSDKGTVIQLGEWEMSGHSGGIEGGFRITSLPHANEGCFTVEANCRLLVQAGSVDAHVDWWTDALDLSGTMPVAQNLTETTNLTATLTGLPPDTALHYRHRAGNGSAAQTSAVTRAFTTLGAVTFPSVFARNEGTTLEIEGVVSHFGVASVTATLWFGEDANNLSPVETWSFVATPHTCHKAVENCAVGKMYFYQFTAEYVYGGKTRSYATPVRQYFTRPAGAVKTLHWGGGDKDIANGTPLPTDPQKLSGVWDKTTKNWSVDAHGSQYVAWQDGDDMTAVLTSCDVDNTRINITLAADVVMNRLHVPVDLVPPGQDNIAYHLTSPKPATLTLAGRRPEILVREGWSGYYAMLWVQNGVEIAAPDGFAKRGFGRLFLETACDRVEGRVSSTDRLQSGGLKLWESASSLARAAELSIGVGADLDLNLHNSVNTKLKSDVVVNLSGGGRFNIWGSAAASQEIGQLVLDGAGFLMLGAGNNLANTATFTLTHPTEAIRRPDGSGTLQVCGNVHDDAFTTRFVVPPGSGVPTDVMLPWAYDWQGRALQVNGVTGLFEPVATDDAPDADLTKWIPGSRYRVTGAFTPTGELPGITLDSLSFNNNGTCVFTIADNATLTLSSGHLCAQIRDQYQNVTIKGGRVTTSTNTLYILTGTGGDPMKIESQLTGPMNVVKSGLVRLEFCGAASNSHTGVTHVNCGVLALNRGNNNIIIPGDIVVNNGATLEVGGHNVIAPGANVTIRENGCFNLGGCEQVFNGAVTNEHGLMWIHGDPSVTFAGPGFGVVFANGGVFENRSNSHWPTRTLLLTDVFYPASAEHQAVITAGVYSLPRLDRLSLSSAAVDAGTLSRREFRIEKSGALLPNEPEMVLDFPLAAENERPAELVKTGGGVLSLERYAGHFHGSARVLDGTLLVNGPFTTQAVMRAISDAGNPGAWTYYGLESTAGLMYRQPVVFENARQWVNTIPDNQTMTVDEWRFLWNYPGTNNLAFLACGSLGTAEIFVSGSGVLGGTGGTGGSVTIENGGTLAPGKIFHIGGGLEFQPGASWQVNPLATGECEIVHVADGITLDGTCVPVFGSGPKRPKGVWTIATFGGSAKGKMSAPQGCSVRVVGNTVVLSSREAGTLFLVR